MTGSTLPAQRQPKSRQPPQWDQLLGVEGVYPCFSVGWSSNQLPYGSMKVLLSMFYFYSLMFLFLFFALVYLEPLLFVSYTLQGLEITPGRVYGGLYMVSGMKSWSNACKARVLSNV